MNNAFSLSGSKLTIRLRLYDAVIALLVVTTLAFYDIKLVFLGMQVVAFGYTLLQMLLSSVRRHVLWYLFWLVVLCGYSLLSLTWADRQNTTALSVTLSMVQVGLICCCIINYGTNAQRLRRIVMYFLMAAVILCIRFVILVPMADWGQGDRFSKDTIFGSNAPGMVLAYAAVLVLWLLLEHEHTTAKRLGLLSVMVVFMFVSMMTGTRKGIIIFVVGLTVLLLGRSKNLRNTFGKALLIAAIIIAVYIAMMEIPVLYGAIGYRIESLVAGILGEETDNSASGRARYFADAMNVFMQHPILGVGQDGYRYLNPYALTYSHNNYAEMLANLGVLGFGAFYCLHIWLLRRGIRARKVCLLPLCIVTILLVNDIAAVSFTSEITYILLGIAISAATCAKTQTRNNAV